MTDETESKLAVRCIRTARVIGTTPAALWRAWTHPGIVKTWWGKTAKGTNITCELEPRVGGRLDYRLQLPANEAESRLLGEVIELSSPVRIVFNVLSWDGQHSLDGTRVTVEFMDMKDGSSRAVITHEGITAPQQQTWCLSAWSNALQDLASAVNS